MKIATVVTRVWDETPEVRCFELTPKEAKNISFEPGAHIEVYLDDRVTRHYSLWNGPSDLSTFLVGVKHEVNGRGGSKKMHDLREGADLEISAPRNNFALHAGDGTAIMFAGGIGITPILAMARARAESGLPYELHFFTRDADSTPFRNQIEALSNAAIHSGLPHPEVERIVQQALSSPSADKRVYFCGPAPFMDLIERAATDSGWPKDRVHSERFGVDPATLNLSGEEFEIVLAKSGKTLTVGSEQTIVQCLEAAGVSVPTSCEMGICGTCMTKVLEGEPDHRDEYMDDSEKSAGTMMAVCVSRSKSRRLVLDL